MADDMTYKVALGPVTQAKLPPGDPRWPAFNSSFINYEMTAGQIACALYEGRPITTWHKNNWRNGANFICGQHLGIDCDTEDERSTIAHLLTVPIITDYAAILYTTPSHTPEKPRARALFLLDQPIQQAVNYANAAAALVWTFGAAADAKCKDAARFYYGPRPGGCDMQLLDHEMPIAKVREMITAWQAAQEQRRPSVIVPPTRYQPPDHERLADALRSIDPWGVSYDEWVSILMAIHSSYPGNDGLAMAIEWGNGEGREVETKWRSFVPNGNHAGKVGVGTIFAKAKDMGWEPKPSTMRHIVKMNVRRIESYGQ